MNSKTKSLLGIFFVLGLFVLSSYLVRQNMEFLESAIGNNYYGILVYFFITIFAVVFAPVSMMPLIPIVSNVYGWFLGGILTYAGWILGSIIVFFICRTYGVPLVKRFISLKTINSIESKIPKENLFLDILLLRMITPVDILSYALGLFSKVNFKIYILATALGILPFTFIWSYLGTMPLWYQIGGIFIVIFVITLTHIIRDLKKNY
ncbi:MAG TPA: VTT domain-containing protein [Candidatus Nanoarchaeia archaeon]|nr:VTT domain-containing protein [Candidatus Nanoarchaeia archaeon]